MGDVYYYQPRYFEKFSCLADKCTDNCCYGWRIDWFKHEYEKLLNADCSAELKEKVCGAFEPIADEALMKIKLGENGRCPLLSGEGLCGVQKELGPEYLSFVCQTYPRKEYRHKDRIMRCCAASCQAVIELLLEDEHAMELESTLARGISDDDYMMGDKQRDVEKYPKLFYRLEMFSFFENLIADKRRSVETSIILGALAAKKISDAAEADKVTEIPHILKDIRPQLNSRVTEKSVEEIKPNYNIKLKIVNNIIVKFFGGQSTAIDLSPIYENGGVSEEKYLLGLEKTRNALGTGDRLFRNLALNTFMQLNMPLYLKDRTIFENYMYFASVCAVYRMVAAVTGLSSDNIKEDFIARIARFNRTAEHNQAVANEIMDDLKNIGFNSAAHLALIIK